MPHKMTKPSVQAGTNKVVAGSPRRSIIARATEAVANTRKAIGKVAGRPTGKSAARSVAPSAAPVRRAPTPARTKAGRGPAARVMVTKKGGVKPAAAKKVVAKKAVPSLATAKDAARKTSAAKTSAAKKAATAKKVTLAKTAPKKAAAKKAAAKRTPAKKAAVKRAVPRKAVVPARGVTRGSGGSGQPASHESRRTAVKSGAKRAITRSAAARPAVIRAVPVRPPRKGYTDERFLNHQRNVLEKERATYLEQASSLQEEAELLVAEMEPGDNQFDEESGEGGTVAVDRERDLTLSAQALEAVEEINAALAKIDSGKYGVCEGCGELIPRLRLEALPYARLCMACKSGGLSRR